LLLGLGGWGELSWAESPFGWVGGLGKTVQHQQHQLTHMMLADVRHMETDISTRTVQLKADGGAEQHLQHYNRQAGLVDGALTHASWFWERCGWLATKVTRLNGFRNPTW